MAWCSHLWYGWVVLFVCGLQYFFSGPGQTFVVSTFITTYVEEFTLPRYCMVHLAFAAFAAVCRILVADSHACRGEVSFLYALGTTASGLTMPFLGRWIDMNGTYKATLLFTLLFSVACVLNSFIQGPITMACGFFLVRLCGQGSFTLIPRTALPQWFVLKRGRAFSLMNIGVFLSSTVLPPLSATLIHSDAIGWRLTWRLWAGAVLLVFLPLAAVLLRGADKPRDMGLLPDGPRHSSSALEMTHPGGGFQPLGAHTAMRPSGAATPIHADSSAVAVDHSSLVAALKDLTQGADGRFSGDSDVDAASDADSDMSAVAALTAAGLHDPAVDEESWTLAQVHVTVHHWNRRTE